MKTYTPEMKLDLKNILLEQYSLSARAWRRFNKRDKENFFDTVNRQVGNLKFEAFISLIDKIFRDE